MLVYNKIKSDIFGYLIIIMLIMFGLNFFNIWYDDTDGKTRSGLSPHTDNLTKCQYLSSKNGGLTPRVDSKGNHICH